ncbi:MAG: hypothetical protein AUJ52_10785 [Elusimicrobia bacterium CG1_02_63_36]|nr:MAG: hypothetical protein AUJ52_10785 [Elusimicrobia bacterium CG1_02_63_36]PIP82548.1 MAG: hypothetical protein COR54_14170 [Elusimicrobia bacterium CG22_combo_CG10-13_8_21_14_all_63_91]PJA12927.1 MAG: hypothetical protein COX66_16100 [Elusimicrobia bacterium CG_4_10_14_0_2_um_filter_63_34]PJB25824.1 MAG: hypothetical protein CO113_06650 [Elusimicrobia bacterium CG_4_9_14_3_um_filter_62_55]
MSAAPRGIGSRLTGAALNGVLLSASLAATALMLEGGLRLFTGARYLDVDLRLRGEGIAYAPGQIQRWKRIEWDVLYSINSKGFRDREYAPPTPEGSLLVVGDSFTEGYGIDFEKCYVKLLEKDLREERPELRVYNGGLSGRGIPEYRRVYEEAFASDPGIGAVVMGLDVSSDILPADRTGPEPAAPSAVPVRHRFFYPFKRFFSEHSVLYNFVRRPAKISPELRYLLERVGLMTDYAATTQLPFWDGGDRTRWEATTRELLKFAAAVNASGRGFAVLLIAHKSQIEDDFFDYQMRLWKMNVSREERFGFNRYLVDFCARNGIPVLDMTGPMREENARNPKSLFFRTDGHWNPAGHAFVAARLAEFVAESRLLKNSI